MNFNSFQNDSAVLRRYGMDASGTDVLAESISVELDVQFQNKRIFNREGVEVTTSAMCFVTPNSTLNGKTLTELKQQWKLFYDSEELRVERLYRIRKPAKDVISHYEIMLR